MPFRDCLDPPHPVAWAESPKTTPPRIIKSGEKPNGTPEIRSLPRPASPDRLASDAAPPPRPRFRRADRCARLRRILVWRASFLGLGDDRLAGDVFGRR